MSGRAKDRDRDPPASSPLDDLANQTTVAADDAATPITRDGDAGDATDDARPAGAGVTHDLAGARPAESAALVLARARVSSALFGAAAAGLGRFRVLERLGGGGMGVVYAAYDPELDRGVALKTVHVPHIGRELALSEAKALARLAHPNVVPVFDVGVEGEHVYIVMELVRGETLGAWVKGKSQPEILDVYRQAGQALAAAHGAGLVHRDFKPDNALVGTDGRVRVVDFGLACESADTASGARPRAGGTPRYMAPEQAAGAAVTSAADQYSFGVALREAVRGDDRPVPRWIELILERATAADPAARYASMQVLLRALGRDPARLRRRAIAAGVVVGVVAAAFAIGRTGLASEPPCSGGDRAITAAWDSVALARELSRIGALSAYGSGLAGTLRVELDDHARRWSAGHRAACLAHRRGEQSAALLDRRMACLDRGRAARSALADIVGAADARALPDVARAARALPDPDACGDVRALAGDVEPASPGQVAPVAVIADRIARARIQLAAAHADAARAGAETAVATARAIGYRPVLAEALLVEGHARMTAGGDGAAAIERLTEAMSLALATGSQPLAIEAWARRAFVTATEGFPDAALHGFDVVDGLAARTPSVFARALLHNNAGNVELARGHRAEARALFDRALDEARQVTGPQAVELIGIRHNTAIAIDDPVRRDRLFTEAHTELARLLGADHPDTLTSQLIRAFTSVVSFARAAELLSEVCRGRELHPWLTAPTAVCWNEVADLEAELGDRTAALGALDRAWKLGGDRNPDTLEAAGYRRLWRGELAEAADAFTRALADLPERSNEPWYRRFARARLQIGLGRTRAAQHRPADAAAELTRAVDVIEPIAADRRAVAIDRRLGRARAELARAREALAAPADQIRAPAIAALAWLRAAGAPADEITALDALASAPATAPTAAPTAAPASAPATAPPATAPAAPASTGRSPR